MGYSVKDLKRWLSVAEGAAYCAGRFLLKAERESRKVEVDYGSEVKISADMQSEKIIVDFLQGKFCFPILTEERGRIDGKIKTDIFWVVDPLDGSLNFLCGIPICCVSIALWEKDNPLIGVVYDFNQEELFAGIVGKGAWLNRRPISTSATKNKQKAILFTGVPARANSSVRALGLLVSQISQYRKARWLGSAALSLAYVAAGRGDAYFEKGIMFWDVAAGIAIVSGAEGKYYIKKSQENNSYSVYASNRYLFNRELRLLF